MTKKDFIKKNNGKLFKRTVIKGATTENIPTIKKGLDNIAKVMNCTIKDNGNAWALIDEDGKSTGRIFIKPKVEREKIAPLYFKSNATEFDGGVGELPLASEIDGDSYIKEYNDATYKYELVEG